MSQSHTALESHMNMLLVITMGMTHYLHATITKLIKN